MIKNANEIVAKLIRKTGLKKWKSNLVKSEIKTSEDSSYPLNIVLPNGTYALNDKVISQIANRYEIKRYNSIFDKHINNNIYDKDADIADLIILYGLTIMVDTTYKNMKDTPEFDEVVAKSLKLLNEKVVLDEDITSKEAKVVKVQQLDRDLIDELNALKEAIIQVNAVEKEEEEELEEI